jgi:hypothetical protein
MNAVPIQKYALLHFSLRYSYDAVGMLYWQHEPSTFQRSII